MAMIPHKRFDDATKTFVECDGNMVDIGTLVAPNRYLCVRCRAVRVREPNPIEVESFESAPAAPPEAKPNLLGRIWKALWGS